jgi:hypothetical protein
MGHFLDRYRRGEYKQVWDELLAQGEAIAQAPLWAEASAIAHETMQRVRQNIEILLPRLRQLGYQFGDPGGAKPLPHWFQEDFSSAQEKSFQPLIPPQPDVHLFLEQLTRTIGPLPLSLQAFYQEVGGVNFIGTHPKWDILVETIHQQKHLNRTGLDPLSLDPLIDVVATFFLDEYREYCEFPEDWPGGSFRLELAPDSHHKYGVSGGAPYEMEAPDGRIDGLFLNEWHHTTFVDYLRTCLHFGGLPELELVQEHKEVSEALAYLRQDLLPI